jgi:hypothetical protein
VLASKRMLRVLLVALFEVGEPLMKLEEVRCWLQLLRCLDARSTAGVPSAFEGTAVRRGQVRGADDA